MPRPGRPCRPSVEIAGPGFINIRLTPDAWRDELRTILREGDEYGLSTVGGNERVNVEYVSANPTGPMHMGHCRGAVVGDSLARVLEAAGFRVTKEYYVNDAGAQVDTLARSVHLRYREALGEDIGEIPEGMYPGDYLMPVGALLAAEYRRPTTRTRPKSEWLAAVPRCGDQGDARPHPPRSRACSASTTTCSRRRRSCSESARSIERWTCCATRAWSTRACSSGPRASIRTTNGSRSS